MGGLPGQIPAQIEVAHVAFNQADARLCLRGFLRQILRQIANMEGERSRPVISTPARAVGISTRPVPQPTSSTGPPAACAISTKNATSTRVPVGRVMVVEFRR